LPEAKTRQKTAIVVGAGIAGLTTAWQLIQRGWNIRLVDKHAQVACGASGNAAAILLPRLSLDDAVDNEFYIQSFCFARQQYAALQQRSEQSFWFETGVLNGYDSIKAGRLLAQVRATGLLEPAADMTLSDTLTWLYCRYAGWLRPQVLCECLYRNCGDALQLYQAEVVSLSNAADSNSVYDSEGELICSADSIVFANAHTITDIEQFDYLPVQASRGQITTIRSELLQREIPAPVSATAYCTPEYNGEVCIGASYTAAAGLQLSTGEQQVNIDKINALLPELVSSPVPLSGRASYRAVSDDRVALVGAAPDRSFFTASYGDLHHGRPTKDYPQARHLRGVYLNVAHGSRGFCSSFLAAEILASMMQGSVMPVNKTVLDYLNPARFLVRQLKRNPPQID
jgi:tRNA 5-methylaminomethyl-2-thiouridine biosynthesis bifunctional protein